MADEILRSELATARKERDVARLEAGGLEAELIQIRVALNETRAELAAARGIIMSLEAELAQRPKLRWPNRWLYLVGLPLVSDGWQVLSSW